MSKAKEYAEDLFHGFEEKRAKVDTSLHNFEQTMAPSDSELHLANSNERVLRDNDAYNSPNASDELRKAIETRSLGSLSKGDFLNLYKQALYGFSSAPRTLESPQQTQLAPIPEDYNRIPVNIEPTTIVQLGHTQKYLLDFCNRFQITRAQLDDLIYLKEEHKTNFPTFVKFLRDGATIDEISQLLDLREELTRSQGNKIGDIPTLKQLYRLGRTFGGPEIDAEEIAAMADQLERSISFRNNVGLDLRIKLALQKAKELDIACLETAIDAVEGEIPIPSQWYG